MEKLLNKLIEKGWKPRENKTEIGKFIVRKRGRSIERPQSQYMIYFYDKNDYCFMSYSLRELVSKDSGLWQLVCDKGLVEMYEGFYWQNVFPLDSKEYDYTDYQYWILESSLIDEDKLEKFLLDNIKL